MGEVWDRDLHFVDLIKVRLRFIEYIVVELKIDMSNASQLRGIVTGKSFTTNRFNTTALKADRPDIYEKYLSASIRRAFRLE